MSERLLAERSACLTDRGRRRVNEDAVLIANLPDGAELVAVADGMGGHCAGAVASQRALEVLQTALTDGVPLRDAVLRANTAVFEEASSNVERQGMGTTLVALVRKGDQYVLANVGDSRAYRIDQRGIEQVTLDHSFIAEAVRSGQLTVEDAERSRWRNAVTRAIGTEAALEVDTFGPFDATEPHTVLLCTDGVHRAVTDEEMLKVVKGAPTPDGAVRALAASAFDAGSDDNMSVVVIKFEATRVAAPTPSAKRARVRKLRRWSPAEITLSVLGFIAVVVYIFILLGVA